MTTSLLEALNTDRTVADKARFVDYFSGDSEKSWWTRTENGTGTYAMSDTIDGGFTILADTLNTEYSQINFNNKRPFDNTGSIMKTTIKQPTNNGGASTAGLLEVNTSWNEDFIGTRIWTSDTYFVLRTADATTVSNTDSDIVTNTQFNQFKWESTTANAKMHINDSLKVTKTTNLPTTRMQPVFMSWNENGNRDTLFVNYCEAWNT